VLQKNCGQAAAHRGEGAGVQTVAWRVSVADVIPRPPHRRWASHAAAPHRLHDIARPVSPAQVPVRLNLWRSVEHLVADANAARPRQLSRESRPAN